LRTSYLTRISGRLVVPRLTWFSDVGIFARFAMPLKPFTREP
jgi:hypothetical protein